MRRIILSLALALLLAGPVLAKDYHARRYDVDIQILENGSLLVSETVDFCFIGGPFTYAYRDLILPKNDSVEIHSFGMDGKPIPAGKDENQAQISKGDTTKITWRFAETWDESRSFTVDYLAAGAFHREEKADTLTWPVLPTSFDYSIESSTIRVGYPERAKLITAPEVMGEYSTVLESPEAFTIFAEKINPNKPIWIRLAVEPGSVITEPARWQVAEEKASSLFLPSLLTGLGVLIIGILKLLSLLKDESSSPYHSQYAKEQTASPNDLPPAVAGALTAPGMEPNWNQAVATIFDLAQRGVLRITVDSKKKMGARRYQIEWVDSSVKVESYEQGLLDMLFMEKKGYKESLTIAEIGKAYYSRFKLFKDSLKQALAEYGYYDERKQSIKRRLISYGVIGIFLSLTGVVIGLVFGLPSGDWPVVFTAAGVFILSIISVIMGATYSPLSEKGRSEAQKWESFSDYLTSLIKSKGQDPPSDYFEDYLVYAATFGLAVKWIKRFKNLGVAQIPEWYQSLALSDLESTHSFVAMIGYMSVIGDGGGGGASGSGGGGAASGAG